MPFRASNPPGPKDFDRDLRVGLVVGSATDAALSLLVCDVLGITAIDLRERRTFGCCCWSEDIV